MAFPVPDHLPRKPLPTDVSSKFLSKISDVTTKSLSAEVVAEWVSELELRIQQTKGRIYERIHQKLPDFERQLESSKSVQTRLRDLSSNVDRLAEALEDPRTGLLPTLLKSLKAHKGLAQRASDAQVEYETLSYLSECRVKFESLTAVVTAGHLKDAVRQANDLGTLLDGAPEALARADVMTEMKNHLRALKDRTEEQLSEAYSRSIRISSTELRISPSVQVRESRTIITLQDILASFSSTLLSSFLTSLRRDIVAHFIDFPLQQGTSYNASRSSDVNDTPTIRFSIFPLPPSPSLRKSAPGYLKSLFDFLRENIFPALPHSSSSSFPQSLYKPTATALLRDVLVPSIPSSLTGLAPFLDLLQDANGFEQEYFFQSDSDLSNSQGECEIQVWERGIAGHYGRKRRTDLLSEARKLILSGSDGRTVRVEASETPGANVAEHVPDVIPVQGDIDGRDDPENGWDFDDDEPSSDAKAPTNGKGDHKPPLGKVEEEEANSWDFEDADAGTANQTKMEEDVPDDSDAWGWGDDEENSTPATSENGNITKSMQDTNGHQNLESQPQKNSEDSAWDSAWDDPDPVPPTPLSPVQPISPMKAPKVAKRLEKLTAKGKGKGPTSPTLSSNPPSSTFSAPSTLPSSISSATFHYFASRSQPPSSVTSPIVDMRQGPSSRQTASLKPPALSLPQKPKVLETYLISGRVQDLVRLISDIITEGRAIASSSIFSDFSLASPDSTSNASTLVLQAAPAVLDLYRATFPVAHAAELSRPARALRFANDCAYVHEEVTKLELPVGAAPAVHEQMRGALERLHALGAWWFDEGVERECQRLLEIILRAEGFIDTGDQDRFDECEAVMSDVLREVRTATGEWKPILLHTKWLRATGRVVETVLTRVISNVLVLPDIPELDSRRLAELCRILNALEGSFVDTENPEAPSLVGDYVPSWFKYSYLSELLEASIADLSYLFDEGALIDFSVDELVRLVRALFADTPLRTNTIAKLHQGHPVPVE